jgi:hypothetical protein
VVDAEDLGMLIANWGSGGSFYDLDGSGPVSGGDLGVLIGAWGACPDATPMRLPAGRKGELVEDESDSFRRFAARVLGP